MATVIRNPYADALQAAAENVVNLTFRARQMKLMREQFEDEQERNKYLNNIGAFSALVQAAPPGAKLGELTFLHPSFKELTGLDPLQDPNLSNLEINPADPNDVLTGMIVESVNALPEDQRKFLLESAGVRALTGATGKTLPELGTQALEAQAKGTGIQAIISEMEAGNVELRDTIGRLALGADQPVHFSVAGRDYQFESKDAGDLALGVLRLMQEGEDKSGEIVRGMAENFRKSVEDKLGIVLSPARALQIQQAVISGDQEALQRISRTSQELAAAVEAANVGQAFGAQAFRLGLRAAGGTGEAFDQMFNVLDQLSETLPKEVVEPLYRDIAKALNSTGQFNLPTTKGPFLGLFGGPSVSVPRPQAGQGERQDATQITPPAGTQGKTPASADIEISIAKRLFEQGVLTEEFIKQRFSGNSAALTEILGTR